MLNDDRSSTTAYVEKTTLSAAGAVTVSALDQATIKATNDSTVSNSGGSALGEGSELSVNGIIATNLVQSAASAYADHSSLTSTSNQAAPAGSTTLPVVILIDAENTSEIDASNAANTSSGGNGGGVVLAFNTLGWQSQNVLFNAVDAILGDPTIGTANGGEGFNTNTSANVTAYAESSTLSATHDSIAVQALETEHVNATTTNAVTSLAAGLANENSTAIGLMLATNMVNGTAHAYIDRSSNTSAGGALTVLAKDDAGIAATNTQTVSSTSISDGGESLLKTYLGEDPRRLPVHRSIRVQTVTVGQVVRKDADHIYEFNGLTTSSGTQTVSNGDEVYAGQDQSGNPIVYKFIGTTATSENLGSPSTFTDGNWTQVLITDGQSKMSFDLGNTDFTTSLWSQIVYDQVASHIPNVNITESNAEAGGGIVVRNDVRSTVTAEVTSSTLTSGGDLSVDAESTSTVDAANTSSVTSSGSSPIAGGTSIAINAAIATNNILGSTTASVTGSSLTTTGGGNVAVTANNASTIDATTDATTISNGTSVGIVLAFNTIGIAPQNFLFNTVDALFGTDIASEQPTQIDATVSGSSTISSSGSVDVSATAAIRN